MADDDDDDLLDMDEADEVIELDENDGEGFDDEGDGDFDDMAEGWLLEMWICYSRFSFLFFSYDYRLRIHFTVDPLTLFEILLLKILLKRVVEWEFIDISIL